MMTVLQKENNRKLIKNKFGLTDNVIPMDIADMDFRCAPAISSAILERAKLEDYSYIYDYEPNDSVYYRCTPDKSRTLFPFLSDNDETFLPPHFSATPQRPQF